MRVLGAGRVEQRRSGECWAQGVCRGGDYGCCLVARLSGLGVVRGVSTLLTGWACRAGIATHQKNVLFGAASRRLLSGGLGVGDSLQLCIDTQNRSDVNCSRFPSNLTFTSPFCHNASYSRTKGPRHGSQTVPCVARALLDLCCKIKECGQFTTQILTCTGVLSNT